MNDYYEKGLTKLKLVVYILRHSNGSLKKRLEQAYSELNLICEEHLPPNLWLDLSTIKKELTTTKKHPNPDQNIVHCALEKKRARTVENIAFDIIEIASEMCLFFAIHSVKAKRKKGCD